MLPFRIYECVKIKPDYENTKVAGLLGGVIGFSATENGEPAYAIMILKLEECWFFEHSDLIPTGKMFEHSDFYDEEIDTSEFPPIPDRK